MKKVAFFGTIGSFHYLAAQQYFGKHVEFVECFSFLRCCEALKKGEVDNAILAIENSLAGSLLPNYNLVNEYELKIVGEQYLKIGLNLVAQKGVKIEDLEYVHSHPMALAQCSHFLHQYPHIKAVEQGDTASCVKNIRDNKLTNVGAIANIFASDLYEVPVLVANIENNKYNFTRFMILSQEAVHTTESNKASICFRLKDKVGKLSDMLTIITEHNVNLSKIQSVPVYGHVNEYFFYLDVEWSKGDYENYQKAMKAVSVLTNAFSILGEYRKAVLPKI
jgi:prephenate dehydratase